MNTNDNVNLPGPNWDKILPRTAIAMVVAFILTLLTRSRSIIVAVEVIDILVILGLGAFFTYGLIRRYSTPKEPAKPEPKTK